MTVVLAVLVVTVGSLLIRLLPLLAARRLPEAVSRLAGWAGASVLASLSVRAIVLHRDPATPFPPVYALAAMAVSLVATVKGRSILVSLAAGATTYVVLSAATGVLVSAG